MDVGHTQQCLWAQNCCILVQIIIELLARMARPLSVPKPRMFSPLLDAEWLRSVALPLAPSLDGWARKCPKGWDQAPSGYPWNKRAGIAPGASHSRRSQRADLFCFFPLPLLHGGVDGSCLRTDAGESRLCLPASPAERGRGCSWIEVLICHLQVLCIPRQEISGAKHRLFVTYRRALCRARLLKAIWCLRCPDLWFPSLV